MALDKNKLNTVKEVKASARNLRISPRKLRLLTNLIKGMYVEQALINLEFAPQKGAKLLLNTVKSAAANAINNFSLKPENLFIKSVTCDMGSSMKRYFPRARGSAFVIRRKLAHINVVLIEKARSKKTVSRVELFKQKQAKETANIDKMEAVEKKEEKQHIHQHTLKTNEQIKMNKAQNKRRLFNRKSGE